MPRKVTIFNLGGGVLGLNLLKTGKEMTETRLRTVKRF